MSWSGSILWVSFMYDPYLKRTQPAVYNFLWSVNNAVDGWSVAAVTNKKLRWRASLNLSRLRYDCQRCTLAVAQHNLPLRTFNFWKIFKSAFKIYGIWPQAHSVGHIHTHLCNAVPLMWGSLRLAPIIYTQVWKIRDWYSLVPRLSLLKQGEERAW